MANLLLVDDEKRLLGIMAAKLRESGHEVLTAESGAEGMSVLMNDFMGAGTIDIVISDFNMPAMNGLEFLQEIYATFGDRYPFIFLSNMGTSDVLKSGMELGSSAFLGKPVLPHHYAALNASLHDVIERYKLRKHSCRMRVKNAFIKKLVPLVDELEKKIEDPELLKMVQNIKHELI
ncbi:MAG: response regulator [Desulfobacteraceae bacterium]|nr:response regulator [Desulfobacteraceae bacterium]